MATNTDTKKIEISENIKGKMPEGWRFYKDSDGRFVLVDCSETGEGLLSSGDIFLYNQGEWKGRFVCLGTYLDLPISMRDCYFVVYGEKDKQIFFLNANTVYHQMREFGRIKVIGHQDLP